MKSPIRVVALALPLILSACNSGEVAGGPDAASDGSPTRSNCSGAACGAGELCCQTGGPSVCTAVQYSCLKTTTCPELAELPCPVDGGTEAAATLTWYTSCGDPVCHDGVPDGGDDASTDAEAGAGADAGTCPQAGTRCDMLGQECSDPTFTCGVRLVCSDHDPKTQPGGCPVSSRKYKTDVLYADAAKLGALHDQIMHLRLATYHYKPEVADANPKHVGFIIEDVPDSPAVDPRRDGVDVYNYLSMIVATTQVQENEIKELRRELAATRSACGRAK
jgi:hypothetical protein